MAMSIAFIINEHEFRFVCDDRHKHWNGVTVSYPPEQLDDPKFTENLKIALGMYPHVNAACTLAELLTNGNVSAERYRELYEIASAADDSEIMRIISEAHQEKALRDQKALQDTPIPDIYNQPGFVYLIKSDTGLCKIGKTKNPKKRAKSYATHVPFKVEYTALIPSENMGQLEDRLHFEFASKRVNGEWFNLTPDDVEYIKGLAQ